MISLRNFWNMSVLRLYWSLPHYVTCFPFFKHKKIQFFFSLLYYFIWQHLLLIWRVPDIFFFKLKFAECVICQISLKARNSLYRIHSFNKPVRLYRWGNWTFLWMNNVPKVSQLERVGAGIWLYLQFCSESLLAQLLRWIATDTQAKNLGL